MAPAVDELDVSNSKTIKVLLNSVKEAAALLEEYLVPTTLTAHQDQRHLDAGGNHNSDFNFLPRLRGSDGILTTGLSSMKKPFQGQAALAQKVMRQRRQETSSAFYTQLSETAKNIIVDGVQLRPHASNPVENERVQRDTSSSVDMSVVEEVARLNELCMLIKGSSVTEDMGVTQPPTISNYTHTDQPMSKLQLLKGKKSQYLLFLKEIEIAIIREYRDDPSPSFKKLIENKIPKLNLLTSSIPTGDMPLESLALNTGSISSLESPNYEEHLQEYGVTTESTLSPEALSFRPHTVNIGKPTPINDWRKPAVDKLTDLLEYRKEIQGKKKKSKITLSKN